MTETNKKQKPVATIRAGAIKASIWENPSEKGVFYTTTFDRVFTDAAGNTKNATNFTGADNLVVAFLAEKAFAKEQQLRAAHKAAATAEASLG